MFIRNYRVKLLNRYYLHVIEHCYMNNMTMKDPKVIYGMTLIGASKRILTFILVGNNYSPNSRKMLFQRNKKKSLKKIELIMNR